MRHCHEEERTHSLLQSTVSNELEARSTPSGRRTVNTVLPLCLNVTTSHMQPLTSVR